MNEINNVPSELNTETPAAPGTTQFPVSMNLTYDDEVKLFILTFYSDKNPVFQCRMQPENFENFTNDLIRTVKNYNLFLAKQYQEKQNETNSEHLSGQPELIEPTTLSNSTDSDKPVEIQPEQPKDNS